MSENENNSALGDQIREALSEGLASGDFKNLNDLVGQTVNNALREAGESVRNATDYTFSGGSAEGNARHNRQKEKMKQNWQDWKEQHESFSASWSTTGNREAQSRQPGNGAGGGQSGQPGKGFRGGQGGAAGGTPYNQPPASVRQAPLVKTKRVGSVAGVLYKVFGGIGMGIGGLTLLVALLAGGVSGMLVGCIMLLFFFGMIRLGCAKHRRLKRADRYIQLCGSKMYGEIAQLAESTQQSRGYVLRDIKRMLRLGIFPQGHLDEQGTTFMLNDVIYKQYRDAEKARQIRERENLALEEKENRPLTPAELVEQEQQIRNQELNQMIAEGMECIRKLRDMNDAIEGEVISAKLYRLENLLKEIFDKVREYPDQMPQMHKVMDYYLPTTLKLVEAYKEFDQVSVPGEDILSAKAQIEKTLDTINAAFTELLNNLFRNRVYDVTTDAQVLETMLAQEGLTKESISKELEYAKTGRN
ncbi:MAG: 5-bromo-4-chloroindolyl phosphate hydrolysis family protein [Lachnospiraceae bacterium]|nr:5-bromo-4-chloroindolyl phosphate hydrolysis family protein [Lachnospiraceae bacterium]